MMMDYKEYLNEARGFEYLVVTDESIGEIALCSNIRSAETYARNLKKYNGWDSLIVNVETGEVRV